MLMSKNVNNEVAISQSIDGIHGESTPKGGTYFRLRVYNRVGNSRVEGYERVEKNCHLGISKRL